MERTGAGVEWLTPVPEVPGSILSWGTFQCGLDGASRISTAPEVMVRNWSTQLTVKKKRKKKTKQG